MIVILKSLSGKLMSSVSLDRFSGVCGILVLNQVPLTFRFCMWCPLVPRSSTLELLSPWSDVGGHGGVALVPGGYERTVPAFWLLCLPLLPDQ